MVLVEGYFDESGDLEVAPGIFCVSGYFIASESAKSMDTEWAAVLDKHGIPYFHMVDCAHGVGIFAGMDVEQRSEIVRALIELIKKYTLEGFSVFARADAYEDVDAPDVYSECAWSCVTALQQFMKMSRVEGKIAYFFELGHKNKGRAYNYIAQKLKRPTDSLTFAAKEEIRLLQAADLLAWQSTKYAKDWLYPKLRGEPPKREPRKDFKSLVEHDHSFMHTEIRDGKKKSMAIELWPISKRSPNSVDISIGSDGPIIYWREAGDPTPIVPIDETMGWRMGGGRMAYVKFRTIREQDNEVALAFDEPRLHEAVEVLIQAMAIYAEKGRGPLLPATEIDVDFVEGASVLHIRFPNGVVLHVHLPDEATARLKEQLERK